MWLIEGEVLAVWGFQLLTLRVEEFFVWCVEVLYPVKQQSHCYTVH